MGRTYAHRFKRNKRSKAQRRKVAKKNQVDYLPEIKPEEYNNSEEFDTVYNDSLTKEISNNVKKNGPYRIVDISYLLQQTVTLQSDHNKLCADGQLQYIKENRQGLSSSFIYKCNNCDMEKTIYNENIEKESLLNIAAVWGTISNGSTYADLCQFLNILDIPTISSEMYCDIETPFITENNSNSPKSTNTDQNDDEFLTLCERSDEIKENQEFKYTLNMDDEFYESDNNIKAEPEFNKETKLNDQYKPTDDETCDVCGKVYKYKKQLLKHKSKHIEKKIPCDICGTLFEIEYAMLDHRRKEHGTKSCPYCEETLVSSFHYYKHMEKEHNDKKTAKCSECSETFFVNNQLDKHKIIHTGEKCCICDICGKQLSSKSYLKSHMDTHSDKKAYSCSDCGKSFNQNKGLKNHQLRHSKIRSYICSICGSAFTVCLYLTRHITRVHKNERPFKCDYCDKSFYTNALRKRHHVTHTEARDYKCEFCEKEFNRHSNLKVHIRIHTGEKPHVCEHCGKRFIYAHVLRAHLLTHEK